MEIVYLSVIFILSLFIVIDFVLDANRRKEERKLYPLRKPKDVKAGERIVITVWNQNVQVDCLNNNPTDKKMFIRVWYLKEDGVTKQYQDNVYEYNNEVFKHFSTVNPVKKTSPPINQNTEDVLEQKMKVLLSQERYEEAAVLRDAIDKLKELAPVVKATKT